MQARAQVSKRLTRVAQGQLPNQPFDGHFPYIAHQSLFCIIRHQIDVALRREG